MSTQGECYVPNDDILCELGRMQVLHSHLDHALRLAIKRMHGIPIDDPGYSNETRGMAASLRERARELITHRYGDDDDTAGILNKALDDAEEATMLCNRALHGVWLKPSGEQDAVLHDRDNTLKTHVAFQPPTAEDLKGLSVRIERSHRVLNQLTRELL